MAKRKTNKNQGFKIIAMVASGVLLVVGVATWWAYQYSTGMVRSELQAQRIFFPQAGSASFKPDDYPELQKYAGQQVDDGVKARAYANGYIGRHLEKVAEGRTYSEVSAEFQKNPEDKKLSTQRQTLFMGETLRGLLLNAYAFWTIGKLLQVVSVVSVAASIVLFAVTWRLRKNN